MVPADADPVIAPPPVESPPVAAPEVNLFRGFTPEEIASFMSQVETLTLQEGEIVLEAGGTARALYVLAEGAVRLELPEVDPTEGTISELTPVSVFGESSFFHEHPHSTTVRCTAPTQVLRLTRAKYDEWLSAQVPMAFKLMLNAAELLAGRLFQTDQWIQRTLHSREQGRIHTSWTELRSHLAGRVRGTGSFMSGGNMNR